MALLWSFHVHKILNCTFPISPDGWPDISELCMFSFAHFRDLELCDHELKKTKLTFIHVWMLFLPVCVRVSASVSALWN